VCSRDAKSVSRAERDINVTPGMSRLRAETIYFDKETNSLYFGVCEHWNNEFSMQQQFGGIMKIGLKMIDSRFIYFIKFREGDVLLLLLCCVNLYDRVDVNLMQFTRRRRVGFKNRLTWI
jgi:hypothetical protein